MPVSYITADKLAEIIRDKDKIAGRDYLVVDVRDQDYEGGNIKGCVNYPSAKFLDNVNALILDNHEKKIPEVIFHCSMSQIRGPKAARAYAEIRDNLEQYKDSSQEIYILQDGFSQFQAKFRNDPLLVENWDKNVWGSA